MSARQYLADVTTLHQVFLQRFAGGEAKKAIKALNRLRRDINARLAMEPTEFQRNRLLIIAADINALYVAMATELSESLKKSAAELVVDEAEFAAKTASKASIVDWAIPSSDSLVSAVLTSSMSTNSIIDAKTIDAAVKDFAGKKAAQVNQLISDSIVIGDTTQQIQRKVKQMTGTLHRREAETVVHTAINHASSVARKAVYDRNSDLMNGYIWIATLDNKTCPYCGSRDQQKIPLNGEMPPAHYACRCTTIPDIKNEYKIPGIEGERPAIGADGVEIVKGNTSYGGWLKKQPIKTIDEALGVERSKLFRSGKLTLDKFTDPTGKVYSVQQLKAMHHF